MKNPRDIVCPSSQSHWKMSCHVLPKFSDLGWPSWLSQCVRGFNVFFCVTTLFILMLRFCRKHAGKRWQICLDMFAFRLLFLDPFWKKILKSWLTPRPPILFMGYSASSFWINMDDLMSIGTDVWICVSLWIRRHIDFLDAIFKILTLEHFFVKNLFAVHDVSTAMVLKYMS